MVQMEELERRALARAKAERVRIVKLAGQERYLARSRTVEPGAYYELSVSPWGRVSCSCPGFSYRSVCKHAAALKARLSSAGPTLPPPPLQDEANDIFERIARNARGLRQ